MANTIEGVYKLSDFAEYELSKDLTHAKTHLKSLLKIAQNREIILNTISLPNKYIYFIEDATTVVELTDHELLNYKFQPKKFCQDYYGDIELWSLLLKVNHMLSITEFNTKRLRIFKPNIFDILNEMFILEKENIDRNEERLSIMIDECIHRPDDCGINKA